MFYECNLGTCDKGYATLIWYKCFNSPNGSTRLIGKSSFINSLQNQTQFLSKSKSGFSQAQDISASFGRNYVRASLSFCTAECKASQDLASNWIHGINLNIVCSTFAAAVGSWFPCWMRIWLDLCSYQIRQLFYKYMYSLTRYSDTSHTCTYIILFMISWKFLTTL